MEESDLRLSQATVTRIGSTDFAQLSRLDKSGWRVEEHDLTGRVIAQYEDLGVFVSRERNSRPWAWRAWLHDESTAVAADTLTCVLEALAFDLKTRADQLLDFAERRR